MKPWKEAGTSCEMGCWDAQLLTTFVGNKLDFYFHFSLSFYFTFNLILWFGLVWKEAGTSCVMSCWDALWLTMRWHHRCCLEIHRIPPEEYFVMNNEFSLLKQSAGFKECLGQPAVRHPSNNFPLSRFTRRVRTWRRTSAPTRGRSRTAAAGRSATGGSPGRTSSRGIWGNTRGANLSDVTSVNAPLQGVTTLVFTWRGMQSRKSLKMTDQGRSDLILQNSTQYVILVVLLLCWMLIWY